MPIIVDCPSCSGKLRVPEEFLGRKVKCPKCTTVFQASAGAAPPTAPAPPSPPPLGNGDQVSAAPAAAPMPAPPPPSQDDERPWEQPYHPGVRRDGEPHRGVMILVFGILSLVMLAVCGPIGLPFGIAAWVMGSRDLRKIRAKEMDPQGMGLTQAGWICGIVGTILDGLYTLVCAGYFLFIFVVILAGASAPPPRPIPPPPPNRNFQLDAAPLRSCWPAPSPSL